MIKCEYLFQPYSWELLVSYEATNKCGKLAW